MTKELPCASLYTDSETDIEPILTNSTAPGVPIMMRSIITRLTPNSYRFTFVTTHGGSRSGTRQQPMGA